MSVAALEIQRREGLLAGAYEKIVGVLRFAFDPASPANEGITDLGLAPRNAQGRVEAWADFYLLRPIAQARSNRALLLDVPNRGRKVALGMLKRHPDQGAPGDIMSMMGSTLPFARTRGERAATGDPRPSLEERYGSRAAYLERARAGALALVAARHALDEDVEAMVERAARLWDWVQSTHA